METTLAFLRELEAEFPPPAGQHHSLTFAQYGSDEAGWQDKLCLTIRYSSGSQNFLYGEGEALGSPEMLAEIRAHLGSLR